MAGIQFTKITSMIKAVTKKKWLNVSLHNQGMHLNKSGSWTLKYFHGQEFESFSLSRYFAPDHIALIVDYSKDGKSYFIHLCP